MTSVEYQSPDHDDYIAALEVMHEVSEQFVADLGTEVVKEAEKTTFRSSELEPRRVIGSAEALTFYYGVTLSKQLAQDIEELTVYTTEVTETGEALSAEEESQLDESVADEADKVLEREGRRKRMAAIIHINEQAFKRLPSEHIIKQQSPLNKNLPEHNLVNQEPPRQITKQLSQLSENLIKKLNWPD